MVGALRWQCAGREAGVLMALVRGRNVQQTLSAAVVAVVSGLVWMLLNWLDEPKLRTGSNRD